MERIALLIDQMGKGDNVFEQFATEFERHNIGGTISPLLNSIQQKVELIERRLQDLSEKITAENENEDNIYRSAIKKTRNLLSVYLTTLNKRNLDPSIDEMLDEALERLLDYLALDNIEGKSMKKLNEDFNDYFDISSHSIELFKERIGLIELEGLSREDADSLSEIVVKYIVQKQLEFKQRLKGAGSLFTIFPKVTFPFKSKKDIVDGEDVIYSGSINVWIDTTDPEEGNRFMYIVASALSQIENVEIEIEKSGTGSIWQSWRIIINGWFAKEEVKQIVSKGGKALEAYSFDKSIESVVKNRINQNESQEEIQTTTEIEDRKLIQKIKVEKEKEELEALKLDNMERRLKLNKSMSEHLAQSLISIDSNYRIELEGVLLIAQIDGIIHLGNVDDIDNNLEKSK